ncbi:excinuclease ABC subunit A [Roseovarius sp. S1116L3]|uniref:excinuclease ABC subunit A n=1 Tax=Roseovarius roseus TaxID=3342636 RepID=UPI00372BF7BB
MRKTIFIAAAAMLSIMPLSAMAGNSKGCPPGLAKKQNGCLPPGQAKKIHGRGDYLSGDYVLIRNPGRYGLDRDETYYRMGDKVYRVDRDTKEILDLIGAVSAILN